MKVGQEVYNNESTGENISCTSSISWFTLRKPVRARGPVPMNALSKFNAPEQFVYDMLSNSPKRWNWLNEAEQLHANWYITQHGGVR